MHSEPNCSETRNQPTAQWYSSGKGGSKDRPINCSQSLSKGRTLRQSTCISDDLEAELRAKTKEGLE